MTIAKPRVVRETDVGGWVVELTDGTLVAAPAPTSRLLASEPYRALGIATHLDVATVCQIAVWRLLQTAEMVSMDLDALLEGRAIKTSEPFMLRRVFFGWPTQDEDIKPMPSAAILVDGETDYEGQGMGVDIDPDTADRYGEGTVLRPVSEVTQPVSVVVWCAHKEERRAVRAAFERVFAVEPQDQRRGRHVVVPEYYDRVVQVDLASGNPAQEGPNDAQTNIWAHRINLTCSVVQVDLVGLPAKSRVVFRTSEIGPDVTVDPE